MKKLLGQFRPLSDSLTTAGLFMLFSETNHLGFENKMDISK